MSVNGDLGKWPDTQEAQELANIKVDNPSGRQYAWECVEEHLVHWGCLGWLQEQGDPKVSHVEWGPGRWCMTGVDEEEYLKEGGRGEVKATRARWRQGPGIAGG